MSFEEIRQRQINLPVVGAVSVAAIAVIGLAIFFLTRRKKTIQLKF